jgi:16S rRNA (cytosine1402-N4)-methyltransferase
MPAPPDRDPAHTRRPRYRGTHPRRFEDKYKELAPERYPETVAHVRDQGKTPAGQHIPVLLDEVLDALTIQPGERGVDATLGWGGHAERFLERLRPAGQLLALDADPLELPRTEARLRRLGFGADQLLVRRTNFAGLRASVDSAGWHEGVDFVFADLGVSSMQIDDPARGFSFKGDGPLDMRMNPQRGVSAAHWLARATIDDLVEALTANADEPHAPAIADALLAQRGQVKTTHALRRTVREAFGDHVSDEVVEAAVRRVFQAIRIEVNDEFGALAALLRQLPGSLRRGGRVAFLTFHSGEDRRVKLALEHGRRAGLYLSVSDAITRASAAERRRNPRSGAAKLRWARVAL